MGTGFITLYWYFACFLFWALIIVVAFFLFKIGKEREKHEAIQVTKNKELNEKSEIEDLK